jgi:hypothetical protein
MIGIGLASLSEKRGEKAQCRPGIRGESLDRHGLGRIQPGMRPNSSVRRADDLIRAAYKQNGQKDRQNPSKSHPIRNSRSAHALRL